MKITLTLNKTYTLEDKDIEEFKEALKDEMEKQQGEPADLTDADAVHDAIYSLLGDDLDTVIDDLDITENDFDIKVETDNSTG